MMDGTRAGICTSGPHRGERFMSFAASMSANETAKRKAQGFSAQVSGASHGAQSGAWGVQSLRWSAGGGAIVLRAVLGACAGYCLQEVSKGVERETRTTKERTMKLWVCLAALFMPVNVWAHDVDSLCGPGETTEDGCQENTPGLGFDDPEYFAAHKSYWHERRKLAVGIVEYGICVGAVQELQAQLGEAIDPGVVALLRYWDVVPAHPELDFPGETWRPLEQAEAARATLGILEYHIWHCSQHRSWLAQRVSAAVNKVCPKKPKR
jgi:hypothetical protein